MEAVRNAETTFARLARGLGAVNKLATTRVLFWLLVTLLTLAFFEPLLETLGFLLAATFLVLLNPICVIGLIFGRGRR